MPDRASVFRVLRDPRFRKLVPVDEEAFRELRKTTWRFDATVDDADWQSLEMRPDDSSLEIPDIWEIVPGGFAVEPDVVDPILTSIYQVHQGYTHCITVAGRRLLVIRTSNCLSALNRAESEFDKNDPTKITKYVFHERRINYSLFKIPETHTWELLAYVPRGDRDNVFKTLVEQHGITGLQFEHLWTSDEAG